MNLLRKIPFWGWLLISLAATYGVWNPWGVSLTGMWEHANATPTSVKVLVSLVVFVLFFLMATETWRTLGRTGVLIYLAVVGVLMWVCYDMGWLTRENIDYAQYWAQIPIAMLLTLGFQSVKIYRNMTGRVGVEDPDTVHPADLGLDGHHH